MTPWCGRLKAPALLRRLPIMLLAAAVVAALTFVPPGEADAAMPDVQDHWAQPEISYLSVRGDVTGYPDGTFRPEQPVTRAEFTTMLVVALGEGRQAEALSGAEAPFIDVGADHWASGYITLAWELDLVQGYPGREFQPERQIRRDELTAMVMRARDSGVGTEPSQGSSEDFLADRFRDAAAIPSWARPVVARAVDDGLVEGFPDGTFRPAAVTTRAVAAVLNARLLYRRGRLFDAAGIATAVDAPNDRLTFRPFGGVEDWTVAVAADGEFFHNRRPGQLGALRPGDEVYSILGDSGTVQAVAGRYRWQAGNVTRVPSGRAFRFTGPDGELAEVRLADDADIFYEGSEAAPADLAPGLHADVVYNTASGQARRLWLSRYDEAGRVLAVADAQAESVVVRVETEAGDVREIHSDAVGDVWINGRRAAMGELQVGDLVHLGVAEGRVVFIDGHRGGDAS